MDPDEILKRLGLSDVDPGVRKTSASSELPGPSSPNAVEVDAWDVSRGSELSKNSPVFKNAPPEEAVDFLAAAYRSAPRLVESCSDGRRRAFLEGVLEDPEFLAARVLSRQKLPESYAAAEALGELYHRPGPGTAGEKAADAAGAASEAVSGVRSALGACGAGGDGGDPDGSTDPAKAIALYRRYRSDPALRAICEQAGRFVSVARSRQRHRTGHGVDEAVGVTLGGDPSRLVASEFASLRVPALRRDFYRRLAERGCLVTERRAVKPVGKGPVVVCVDESGSMRGAKAAAAKGFALALAHVARWQKRWAALVGFAGGTAGTLLPLPPGRWDETAVCEWLVHFYGGGTTLDVPLVELPGKYWPSLVGSGMRRGKTDVVMVTDAIVSAPAAVAEAFLRWKAAESVRLVTVLVGASDAGDLAALSDEVHAVSGLRPDGPEASHILSL